MKEELIKRYKSWKDSRRLKKYTRLLQEIGTKAPELLTEFVMQKASQISVRVTMEILDREGIGHCKFCPSRFGLRKFNGMNWICDKHYNAVMAANKKEEQSASKKQVAA